MTDARTAGTVTLGLIADKHLPKRLPALPDTLPDLHAGDVGDLRALDDLGALPP